MSFRLTIDTDNAAFEGDALPYEVALLLERVAAQVRAHRMAGPIRDTNGNTVGAFDTDSGDLAAERLADIRRLGDTGGLYRFAVTVSGVVTVKAPEPVVALAMMDNAQFSVQAGTPRPGDPEGVEWTDPADAEPVRPYAVTR